jgi:hypothetical protein
MKKIFLILILLAIFILGGFFSYRQITERSQEELKEQEIPKEQEGGILLDFMKAKINEIGKELNSRIQAFITKKREDQIRLAISQAKRRSENVKGLYINEFVANSQSIGAQKIREDIKILLSKTELNAVVIDVKEAHGPNLPLSLKDFVKELQDEDIWVIARIVVFRDSSLRNEKPQLYLKTKEGDFWQDYSGALWLDPKSVEVRHYLLEFSKKVVDLGFDELQFDYIRFPSDGNLQDIVFPFYDKEQEKTEVIDEFLSYLSQNLKSHKPQIILSADLFGLVAVHHRAPTIGQELDDLSGFFDYISFMLYPSHYYEGFSIEEDSKRELPALYFPYESEDILTVVSNHPYEVVYRSILSAKDYLLNINSDTKIRPWLQDFSLKADSDRGIHYDAEKVKAQIKAAEDAGASGWLLWNPANIYTKEALMR